MQPLEKAFVLKATLFHAPNWGEVEVLEDVLLQVDERGFITRICKRAESTYDHMLDQAKQMVYIENCQSILTYCRGL